MDQNSGQFSQASKYLKQSFMFGEHQSRRMSQRIFLQGFLRFGSRLIQSVSLCIILFLLLLMANDQTRMAKLIARHKTCCEGRNILLSVLHPSYQKELTKDERQKRLLSEFRESFPEINGSYYRNQTYSSYKNGGNSSEGMGKYFRWIPNPRQKIASLSDEPYVIKNSGVCRGTRHADYIVLIHSAPDNFGRRQGIRNTWGNITLLRERRMEIVFLLGLSKSKETETKIAEENMKHHDIVQGNFIDTYDNLTHKAILGLRWVDEFCSDGKRVMKIDDDVFIDISKLFTDFNNDIGNKEDSIYCMRQPANTSPIQRGSGKWGVDEDEFKNHTKYPVTYCHGFFIIMSTHTARQLYNVAYKVPFFWIDDIYVYGMLTDAAGINQNITDIGKYLSLHTYNSLNCFGKAETKCNLLAGNAPSQNFMELMWTKLLQSNNKSFIDPYYT